MNQTRLKLAVAKAIAKEHLPTILECFEIGLEDSVYAAADKVRALDTDTAKACAKVILEQGGRFESGYGGRVAVVNPRQYGEENWSGEMQAVQKAIREHDGRVLVSGEPLDQFISSLGGSDSPKKDVYVRVNVPGQDELLLVRDLEQAVAKYECLQPPKLEDNK